MLNSTPNYLGAGQPSAGQRCDGPLAWLESLFGIFGDGGTPTYVGAGQPAPTSRSATPGYKPRQPVSAQPTSDPVDPAVPTPCTLPDPFGGGYAIVIPRRE
jgi:hypothetical protein